MTVRCGNHGRTEHVYHDSAADVRACYAGTLFNDDLDPPSEKLHRPNTFGPEQVTFMDETIWDRAMQQKEREEDERVAQYKAERDRRLEQGWDGRAPWPQEPTHALNAQARERDPEVRITKLRLDHVEEGGYAVPDPGDGKLRFLEVDKPTKDRWEGWTFIKVMASDERHKLGSVNPRYGTYKGKAVDLVARLAGADVVELNDYRIAYGQELGECGFCRRTLTDEDSRALGYGPVCAGRHGLDHPRARSSA